MRSFVEGDEVVADWTPEPHHEAFPGMLNGGIIGALLDCHSNWAAAVPPDARRPARDTPPCTVTADYAVKLRRPDAEPASRVRLRARVVESQPRTARWWRRRWSRAGRSARPAAGRSWRVKPGHPAYHRW